MATPAPSSSNVGSSSLNNASIAASTTAAAGGGSGPGAEGGEDYLPGGPMWAELSSRMLQHSGGRPPNPKVNYKRKFTKARTQWEELAQEQVECKKSLASAVAKQVKLQDEINYLVDMIGAIESGSASHEAAALLLLQQRPGAGHGAPQDGQRILHGMDEHEVEAGDPEITPVKREGHHYSNR
ncbi:hypothetical protein OC846_005640 [Tilletia horrida]|uniref:Uncharacterized protein n=1 Tax=Tilletia horrida TaxID=155126 RepID=A0AAN6GK48_9BASI|nr:hypothetical protein OC845_005808 [Tilletia horrida]KAK0545519.1 hypothetical protein OC846_005640 [Tilletia horrida]